MKEMKARKIVCILIYVLLCIALLFFLYQFTQPNSPDLTAADYAFANSYSIPVGAYSFGFLIVSGLFLLGLSIRKAEYSLLLLILSYGFLIINTLNLQSGHYFLSHWLYEKLAWTGLMYIPSHAILLFLLLKQDKQFLQYFIHVLKLLFFIQIIAYLISSLLNGYFASWINSIFNGLFVHKEIDGLLQWITNIMLYSCTGISIYCFIKESDDTHLQVNVMNIRTSLTMESYKNITDFMSEAFVLYQDINNSIDSIIEHIQLGQYGQVETIMNDFSKKMKSLSDYSYCKNQSVNFLLMAYAFQSKKYGINYSVSAYVPENLYEYENDICSFLIHLLNNAVEANLSIPPQHQRFLRLTIGYENGVLSICSENAYYGKIPVDSKGNLLSTKKALNRQTFGLNEMKSIANKYHSSLFIHCMNQIFSLQTILKFDVQKEANP